MSPFRGRRLHLTQPKGCNLGVFEMKAVLSQPSLFPTLYSCLLPDRVFTVRAFKIDPADVDLCAIEELRNVQPDQGHSQKIPVRQSSILWK